MAPGRSGAAEPALTGFTLVHRALRSGTRMLAQALDGIARDDVCDRTGSAWSPSSRAPC